MADGITALMSGGDFKCAAAHLEDALRASDDDNVQVNAMLLLGWALEFAGETRRALSWQEKALALATSRGETVYRSYALWELGIRWLQHGRSDRAEQLLQEGLRVAQLINDQRNAAGCLEGLAWIAAQENKPRKAAVMMGPRTRSPARSAASRCHFLYCALLRDLHDESEGRTRDTLAPKSSLPRVKRVAR